MELRSAVRNDDVVSNPASGIRALARGLSIIDMLAQNDGGLPLTQIARRARLSKSSTHDLVEGLGLDRRVGSALEGLAQATGETVHIALLDGDVAVYVDKIESPDPIRRICSGKRRAVPPASPRPVCFVWDDLRRAARTYIGVTT